MVKPVNENPDSGFPEQILPAEEEVKKALDRMILSPSGWRTVFAGGEESREETISPAHALIVAVAARVFAEYLKQKHPFPQVIVAADTRPTGRSIADSMIKSFTAWGAEVLHIGIAAAPEIMAYARALGAEDEAQGFVYISASHNPIRHNGLKFGLTDGGVLPGEEALALIRNFRGVLDASRRGDGGGGVNRTYLEETLAAIAGVEDRVKPVYAETAACKKEALRAYDSFIRKVADGAKEGPKRLFAVMTRALAEQPPGILADFNGSARTVSIDRDFLSSLGLRFSAINDRPGGIAHRIVPEGKPSFPAPLPWTRSTGRTARSLWAMSPTATETGAI